MAMQAEHQAALQQPQHSLQQTWAAYFPEAPYDASDRRVLLIQELLQTLGSDAGWQLLQFVPYQQGHVVHMDYARLQQVTGSADLAAALEMQPLEGFGCVRAAVHQLLATTRQHQAQALQLLLQEGNLVTLRLYNYDASNLHIRQLKSNNIGKLATVRGTVVRMSHIRPLITELHFTCNRCGAVIQRTFPEGRFSQPTSCPNQGCRSKQFTPDPTSAVCIDWQKVRLQELLGADQQQQGRVPRCVEVELKQDLASSCVVGDVITVLGMVKVLATGEAAPGGGGKPPKNGQQNLFLIYLDGLSVTNMRKGDKGIDGNEARQQTGSSQQLVPVAGIPPNMPDFSVRDLQFILTFTHECQGQQLRVLSSSLCPTIYGHELVKAGLLLALLGGVRKNANSANSMPIRGDIHVLLVGDPGLGKSQLLQAVSAAAPRGLYVCGTSATGAGLTVSVVRDSVTGDAMFEAGAVVLADRGVCCVDEFDKIPQEHQALLEAMEQQEVSVAKAGLVASLPARAAVIAAANPVGGRYDRGKTTQENLKMSAAMMSRFDLTFVLLDRPNEALDQAVSEHVLAMHSGMADRAAAARQRLLQHSHSQATSSISTQAPCLPGSTQPQPGGTSSQAGAGRVTLMQRLKLLGGAEETPLPAQLLRKYIAYARAHCMPVLSNEAKDVLQAFYLQLRADSGAAGAGSSPVTARQLESLVRLAEARARCELREVVTRGDAEDAVEIMRESLFDLCPGGGGLGGLGVLDFRAAPGSRKGKASEAGRFLEAVRRLGQREGRDTFNKQELQALAVELRVVGQDPASLLDKLNDAGDLLKRGPGLYKVSGVNLSGSQQLGPSQSSGPAYSSC